MHGSFAYGFAVNVYAYKAERPCTCLAGIFVGNIVFQVFVLDGCFLKL